MVISEKDPCSSSANRRRQKITWKMDRISGLPESILLHILSLLPYTDEAIRTSILSKKWQYVWTSVPSLTFSLPSLSDKPPAREELQKFVSFISDTLTQCHHTKLQSFKLHTYYDQSFNHQLNLWIRYAVGANVTELDLDLPCYQHSHSFKVPEHLFANSFLATLKLRHCIIVPSGSVHWKMLKKLLVMKVELNNCLIKDILSGSPLLEVLELVLCWGFSHLDITSTSLRSLVLDGFDDCKKGYIRKVEISAPTILSLEVRGSLSLRELLLLDMQSLVVANLVFYIPFIFEGTHQDLCKGLIASLSHVNELLVGSYVQQVLTFLDSEVWSSLVSKRKHLKIHKIDRFCYKGLANLLQTSPDLESLYIQSLASSFGVWTDAYWTNEKRKFQCLQQHLKTVRIVYDCEVVYEHGFLEFLLENACVLDKLIIVAGNTNESSASQASLLQLTRKLLSVRRASKDVIVLFEGFP